MIKKSFFFSYYIFLMWFIVFKLYKRGFKVYWISKESCYLMNDKFFRFDVENEIM